MLTQQDVMRAVIRVPALCLTVFALSVLGYAVGWYSLVIVMMVIVGMVLAFPAWSGSIVGRLWRCSQCAYALPIIFRFGLVLPKETSHCPRCESVLA